VITGGGSRCEGTADLCEEVLGLPAEIRFAPTGLTSGRQLPDGQWATVVGLAYWALGDDEPVAVEEDTRKGAGGVKGIIDTIFRRR